MAKVKKKKRTHKPIPLREHFTLRMVDVPGVKGGEISAVSVRSVSDCDQFLRAGMPVTAAGDKGSILVWRTDDRTWWCEFMVNRQTIDARTWKSIAAVSAWIKEWWPRMER